MTTRSTPNRRFSTAGAFCLVVSLQNGTSSLSTSRTNHMAQRLGAIRTTRLTGISLQRVSSTWDTSKKILIWTVKSLSQFSAVFLISVIQIICHLLFSTSTPTIRNTRDSSSSKAFNRISQRQTRIPRMLFGARIWRASTGIRLIRVSVGCNEKNANYDKISRSVFHLQETRLWMLASSIRRMFMDRTSMDSLIFRWKVSS